MRLTRLQRYYLYYTVLFLLFTGFLAVLERHGMPPRWIGYAFLVFTVSMYATIGVFSRTSDVSEYYVAGRRVPAFFNGMATGADWMSAASFMGLAGTLYLQGFQGLAYIVGWTGGFVLVALLLAPYLRRFGQFTIPDFLSARYGGNAVRLIAVFAAILASFVYVVAQIYGVGVITSRFVSLQFEIGVFVGLAGILVCSFLGGMRAITWTQVAQYLILIVAYLTPVAILSYKVTGVPVPQVVYGSVLQQVTALETELFVAPAETEVRELYRERAATYAEKIQHLPHSLLEERAYYAAEVERHRHLLVELDAAGTGPADVRVDLQPLRQHLRAGGRFTPDSAGDLGFPHQLGGEGVKLLLRHIHRQHLHRQCDHQHGAEDEDAGVDIALAGAFLPFVLHHPNSPPIEVRICMRMTTM